MDVSCILDGFIYLLYSYHGSEEDEVLLISYVYSFKPFIPCDMYSGWLCIPDFIWHEAFRINVYYGHWTFHYSFIMDVVCYCTCFYLKLNVILRHGILKECNLYVWIYMIVFYLLPLLCDWCVWLSLFLKLKKKMLPNLAKLRLFLLGPLAGHYKKSLWLGKMMHVVGIA